MYNTTSLSDIYPGLGGANSQPATQQASGNTAPISPFVTTTWIAILAILIAIRVLYELAD